MPQLNDNSPHFAYPAHRVSLAKSQRSQSWLTTITHYAKLYRQPLTLDWSSWRHPMLIFSRHQGMLLAENLKKRFRFPRDMIFCEDLGYQKQVMLVIIRRHQVYLEAKVHEIHLKDELLPLIQSQHPFTIITSRVSPAISEFLAKIPHHKPIKVEHQSILNSLSPNKHSIQLKPWRALQDSYSIIAHSIGSFLQTLHTRLWMRIKLMNGATSL